MPHKSKHSKKPKKPKKPKKKDSPMATVDLSTKLVVDFTTRRQTGLKQIENWTAGIEPWTLGKVNERITTSPVVASIVKTAYDIQIVDYGRIDGSDERAWQLYPSRLIRVSVADGDEDELRGHFDDYLTELRAEIQTFIDSNNVTHRATVTIWHLHFSTGALEEAV